MNAKEALKLIQNSQTAIVSFHANGYDWLIYQAEQKETYHLIRLADNWQQVSSDPIILLNKAIYNRKSGFINLTNIPIEFDVINGSV